MHMASGSHMHHRGKYHLVLLWPTPSWLITRLPGWKIVLFRSRLSSMWDTWMISSFWSGQINTLFNLQNISPTNIATSDLHMNLKTTTHFRSWTWTSSETPVSFLRQFIERQHSPEFIQTSKLSCLTHIRGAWFQPSCTVHTWSAHRICLSIRKLWIWKTSSPKTVTQRNWSIVASTHFSINYMKRRSSFKPFQNWTSWSFFHSLELPHGRLKTTS